MEQETALAAGGSWGGWGYFAAPGHNGSHLETFLVVKKEDGGDTDLYYQKDGCC